MHFENLVEDISGKKALDILVPKIVGDQHTFSVIGFRGIGHIPKNLTSGTAVTNRLLLNQLPRLLRGYGRTYAGDPTDHPAAVILVCDLDDRCLKTFRQRLYSVLNACNPKPMTRCCIAIEEGEAWLLGDDSAIIAAYPNLRHDVLESYENDSICGTWEVLADAVCTGGARSIENGGWRAVGREKFIWAERITPLMDLENNASTSFCYFREKLRELT